MTSIPEKFKTITRPARNELGQIIPGICFLCGEKSRRDKNSHICNDSLEICWQRAISKGYIVPLFSRERDS